MVGEKKEEDIVGRLEALRKRVPPPTQGRSPETPKASSAAPDAGRRRLARVVGILVIIIILGAVFLGGSRLLKKPVETLPPTVTTPTGQDDAAEQARIAELANAKSERIEEIKEAYAGLPPEYTSERDQLIQTVKTKTTKEYVESVDYETSATNAWRTYRRTEVDKKSVLTGQASALFGEILIKESDAIKSQIEVSLLSDLKGMIIKEMQSEFIPIRLPRDQITGGFAEVGDRVNIHYRWVDENKTAHIKYLAKDGKVISIMRAAGSISLSETERQQESGGGTEGKGNVTSISLGSSGIAISDGPYGASVGFRRLEKSSTYTVNLAEVQKAAAASKISKEELMNNLEKYGVKLTEIERETSIGDLKAEYLMLVEVTEDEAREVVLRLLNNDEKANILVTISKAPSWAS